MSLEPEDEDSNITASALETPQTSIEERGKIQRELGRCILRLQQYEMLGKAIMTAAEVGGSPNTWEARQLSRKEKFSRMTLGTLVKEMKTSWLAPDDVQTGDDDSDAPIAPTEVWIRTRFRHTMDAAEYERTVAAMEQLVEMRNELMHHFLERFNLWEKRGCADAARHLEESYEVIDRHMNELTGWARHMEEAREHIVRALVNEEFQDLLFGRLEPSAGPLPQVSAANLDYSTICALLREAEVAHAAQGWVLLERAIAFVNYASKHAEFPSRYGCSKWRQVLKRSGVFEVEERALPDRSGTVTVYRSKWPPGTAGPASQARAAGDVTT